MDEVKDNPRGLTVADAEYLLEYLKICDAFCGRGSDIYDEEGNTIRDVPYSESHPSVSVGEARRQLKALNEKWKTRVTSTTLRELLPAEYLARSYDGEGEDDCWLPSQVCW